MQTVDNKNRPYYLVCERQWVYHLLIIVAGYFGAFTYLLRGMSSATRRPATWY